ncbi:MAG: hypothetical protein A3E80_05275 [Chlamydiae bacterium RIFCSPHIGHO2_12_FULL_49_9]|nr:MAG: hypothetical protein A3E80_05275 [Chlamydiae bacterium RIFCSPHIGHO2_12_FULL_49_9]
MSHISPISSGSGFSMECDEVLSSREPVNPLTRSKQEALDRIKVLKSELDSIDLPFDVRLTKGGVLFKAQKVYHKFVIEELRTEFAKLLSTQNQPPQLLTDRQIKAYIRANTELLETSEVAIRQSIELEIQWLERALLIPRLREIFSRQIELGQPLQLPTSPIESSVSGNGFLKLVPGMAIKSRGLTLYVNPKPSHSEVMGLERNRMQFQAGIAAEAEARKRAEDDVREAVDGLMTVATRQTVETSDDDDEVVGSSGAARGNSASMEVDSSTGSPPRQPLLQINVIPPSPPRPKAATPVVASQSGSLQVPGQRTASPLVGENTSATQTSLPTAGSAAEKPCKKRNEKPAGVRRRPISIKKQKMLAASKRTPSFGTPDQSTSKE